MPPPTPLSPGTAAAPPDVGPEDLTDAAWWERAVAEVEGAEAHLQGHEEDEEASAGADYLRGALAGRLAFSGRVEDALRRPHLSAALGSPEDEGEDEDEGRGLGG